MKSAMSSVSPLHNTGGILSELILLLPRRMFIIQNRSKKRHQFQLLTPSKLTAPVKALIRIIAFTDYGCQDP
jgi:hypothetical protein